ncbi:MAG: hypothetical protein COT14_03550 [Candidatus Diapherotrites archaeon CG08_land_8_20_14_0_20_30_16]|nr:MAG: hypothetical protein COT14_03550 [Candidatus Diapherotrites archaeon CG08_land_8_20_14_0_20_30_16]
MSKTKFKWNWKYLDPFYPYDLFVKYLEKNNITNKYFNFLIFLIYAFVLAYIILKILALILGGHQAAMIVVSGSMQHYLEIGDIAVLGSPKTIDTTYITIDKNIKGQPLNNYLSVNYTLQNNQFIIKDLNVSGAIVDLNKQGDVVVYYSPLQKKEIIHRAVLGIKANDGTFYLTKGDNENTNFVLDADCDFALQTPQGTIKVQCLYPYALQKENILSKYWFDIPYLGWIKLGPAYLFGWRA